MKELKYLFSEAWKEAKLNPTEAIGSLLVMMFICAFTYYGLWFVHILGI